MDCVSLQCYYQIDTNITVNSSPSHYQNDMNKKNSYDTPCPIARSIAVAGDAWCLLILRDAHAGLTRFDQFRKNLGIAPTMLTRRLATLTEEGVLEKRCYSERPPREEYLLTAAGRDFLPVLFMIGEWGRRYRHLPAARFRQAQSCAPDPAPAKPPFALHHRLTKTRADRPAAIPWRE